MIRSMTGFGRNKYENEGREYSIEIKSVNHKYSDVNVRMPRNISYLEENIKKTMTNNISRGKVDISITFENHSKIGKNIKINKEIAKMYIKELKELAKEEEILDNVTVISISRLPEVLDIQNNDDEEIIWNELNTCLKDAITNFVRMREEEGSKMSKDILKRTESIYGKIEEISKNSTRLIDEYIIKLETRIKEILKKDIIDENRLAQEVVIYSDKCSIEEEITRLKSHISQLNNILNQKEYSAIGKRLDFIIQEMNRETNTIGSKANCLEITNLVIDIKTELENIREQVQNIE